MIPDDDIPDEARPPDDSQPDDPVGLDAMRLPWQARPREDVVREILGQFEDGTPLAVICRDRFMPSRSELYRWMEQDPEVLGRFARARGRWKLSLADDIVTIADTATPASLEVDKLRIWARCQLLARAESAAKRIERRGGRPGDDGTSFEGGEKPAQQTVRRIAFVGVIPRERQDEAPIEGELVDDEGDDE